MLVGPRSPRNISYTMLQCSQRLPAQARGLLGWPAASSAWAVELVALAWRWRRQALYPQGRWVRSAAAAPRLPEQEVPSLKTQIPAAMGKRPKLEQDENGAYLANGASVKGGLNKRIVDAGWVDQLPVVLYLCTCGSVPAKSPVHQSRLSQPGV